MGLPCPVDGTVDSFHLQDRVVGARTEYFTAREEGVATGVEVGGPVTTDALRSLEESAHKGPPGTGTGVRPAADRVVRVSEPCRAMSRAWSPYLGWGWRWSWGFGSRTHTAHVSCGRE